MRIAFVNPPALNNGNMVLAEDCCWRARGRKILPIMLLSCASQVQSVFVDLTIDSPRNLKEKKADLVIYPLVWQYHREIHKKMSVICGNIPTMVLAVPSGYMEDYAKLKPNPFCIIYSEPEKVVESLSTVSVKRELYGWRERTKGIAWVDEKGYHKNEMNPTSIHQIKGTNFNLVPPHYWKNYRVVSYQVTRGCPYRCHFCVWGGSTVTDRTFRMRPARQVAEDLKQLKKYADPKSMLYLLSAQLTTSLEWIKEFHRLMKDDPYPFQSNVNLYDLTDEKAKLLKESGLNYVSVGVEAVTDPLLAKLNKKHRFSHIVSGMKILDKYNDTYRCHLRIGFGETIKDIEETLLSFKNLKASGIKNARFHFGPIIYYKGTAWNETPPCAIERHPGYAEYCGRMVNTPKEWNKVLGLLKEYGWLT